MSQEYSSGVGDSVWTLARPVAEQIGPRSAHRINPVPSVDTPSLNALALKSLLSLYDPQENLFCGRLAVTREGFRREKTSRTGTIIALLGLHRFANSGEAQPFDLASIRNAVLVDTRWVNRVGDLGLLTWYTAEFAPDRLARLFAEFDYATALEAYADGREAETSALAWFLAGISEARLRSSSGLPDLTDAAVDAYHLLVENQGSGGVFGRAASPGLWPRLVSNRFGTFSDQIYSIYALASFAKAFQVEEPLSAALNCANAMRALQGEMGEWWFLYDQRTSSVMNRYPVFSWHQDGMAPIGLLALEQATGQSFHEAIGKGVSWITGANQLGNDLRNLERGVIWDSIRARGRSPNYWEAARSLLNASERASAGGLEIHYELRPDHFGWLLYAFGTMGLPKEAVNVKGAAG